MPYTMIVNIVVFAFNYIPCSPIEAFLMPQMAIVNIVVSQIRKVCVRVHVQQAYTPRCPNGREERTSGRSAGHRCL